MMTPALMLQKTVGFLLMPAGLLWLGLIAATGAAWRRTGRLGGGTRWKEVGPLVLLTVGYTVAGNIHVGHALMRSLEAEVPNLGEPPAAAFDAACVFGGGTESDAFGRPQLACSGDRLMAAARLYHAGLARMLVASGVSSDDPAGPRNLGGEARALWMSVGVPESAILVVETPCRVTSEEVAAFQALKQKNGWQRVALVSSAWHLPRILRLTKRAGMEGIPHGSDWRGRRHVFQWQDCVPQGAGFWRVNLAMWEYVGRVSGR
jgi:uncharacterized SAM-binding protein YcdF (DUF218 family)